MLNNNLTEIVAIIDESGSMGTIKNDTIGGFNSFLEEQQKYTDGKAIMTVVTFSGSVRTPVDGVDVQEVEPLSDKTYRPSGGTALLDAIGETIQRLEDRYTDEEDTDKIPGRVLFAIITDGEENSSHNYTKQEVSKMIKHQTKRHNFEFIFLGANLDAVKEAQSIGISDKGAFNYVPSGQGMMDTLGVLSRATMNYRSSGQATMDIAGTSLESMNTSKK